MITKDEIAAAHDKLAELHEWLAKNSILDIVHEHHAGMAERLRDEARSWREMNDETFASKTKGWTP